MLRLLFFFYQHKVLKICKYRTVSMVTHAAKQRNCTRSKECFAWLNNGTLSSPPVRVAVIHTRPQNCSGVLYCFEISAFCLQVTSTMLSRACYKFKVDHPHDSTWRMGGSGMCANNFIWRNGWRTNCNYEIEWRGTWQQRKQFSKNWGFWKKSESKTYKRTI